MIFQVRQSAKMKLSKTSLAKILAKASYIWFIFFQRKQTLILLRQIVDHRAFLQLLRGLHACLLLRERILTFLEILENWHHTRYCRQKISSPLNLGNNLVLNYFIGSCKVLLDMKVTKDFGCEWCDSIMQKYFAHGFYQRFW